MARNRNFRYKNMLFVIGCICLTTSLASFITMFLLPSFSTIMVGLGSLMAISGLFAFIIHRIFQFKSNKTTTSEMCAASKAEHPETKKSNFCKVAYTLLYGHHPNHESKIRSLEDLKKHLETLPMVSRDYNIEEIKRIAQELWKLKTEYPVQRSTPLVTTIKKNGLIIANVEQTIGDGRCLFRSMAANLCNFELNSVQETEAADMLRSMCCDYLRALPPSEHEDYLALIIGSTERNYVSIASYISDLSRSTTFAGDVELSILANLLGLNLNVLLTDAQSNCVGKRDFCTHNPNIKPEDRINVAVHYNGSNHYSKVNFIKGYNADDIEVLTRAMPARATSCRAM